MIEQTPKRVIAEGILITIVSGLILTMISAFAEIKINSEKIKSIKEQAQRNELRIIRSLDKIDRRLERMEEHIIR